MKDTTTNRRWGTRKDVCNLADISSPTLHRIERCDPNAPRPRRLPTGGVLRDLDAWREYFANLPESEDEVA